tara:strand:+ start:691 stop:1380 length:690 start_codon:yes stop_codon:yes gene_type:complete
MKVCLIPARGGSKRIKNKNIKKFFGEPLIAYAIKLAIKSKLFDKVIVSTDSKKIAKIAEKYGATVPFLRPKKISNDYAVDKDVINHFLEYAKTNKIKINILCYLYATTPLLKSSTLHKCYKLLIKSKYPKVTTICKFPHSIERALIKNKKGEISFKNKKFINYRSQNFREHYHDTGQCYWFNINNINNFIKQKWIKTLAVELNKYDFQDLDTINDFNILSKLYKINKLK